MKTKVTVLGEPGINENDKLKIKFVKCLLTDGTTSDSPMSPSNFTNIILLSYALGGDAYKYDVMYAYNLTPQNGCVYLGHFNDGIV